jgi:hypothetical protein
MHQVGNDLRMLRQCQRCAHNAGAAVVQGAHRVEQVCESAHPCGHRAFDVFESRVAVPNLHAHAHRNERRHHREVARALRRKRDDADGGDGVQALHFVHVALARERRLRAEPTGVDERAFEMHAEHPRSARWTPQDQGRKISQGAYQLDGRGGQSCRQQRRGAELRMGGGHRSHGRAAVHRVGAAASVDMQVHEAGQHNFGAVRRHVVDGLTPNPFDPACVPPQFTPHPTTRREYQG